MQSRGKFTLSLILVVFSHPGLAQAPKLSVDPVESRIQAVTILGNESDTDLTGAPFSAIEESLYSQKQHDGTYVDRTLTTTHIYRDSQGRTRAERYVTSYLDGAGKSRLMSIYIADPVAGVLYRLDPENYKATRWTWDANSRALAAIQDRQFLNVHTPAETAVIEEFESHATVEALGVDRMEGLSVEGYRQTLSVPARLEGNERPFQIVLETWVSPELKVAVFSKRDNSIVGRDALRLKQIKRAEPDAVLFRVPSDYKFEDGPAPGSIVVLPAVP